MIYTKFPKRYLAIIVVCLIVTLAAVGAVLLIYFFNATHSPLVLTDEGGGLNPIASSTVGLFRSLPLLQKDQYEEAKVNLKLQPKLSPHKQHDTQSILPIASESDLKNLDYYGDDEDSDAYADSNSFDYASNLGENKGDAVLWRNDRDNANGKSKNSLNRLLVGLERIGSTGDDTENFDAGADAASELDDVSISSSSEMVGGTKELYSKIVTLKTKSNRGDTIYIDDYEHSAGHQSPTAVNSKNEEVQHQSFDKSDISDPEYFYEIVPEGCSDDDDDYDRKCGNHKGNMKNSNQRGQNLQKLAAVDLKSTSAQLMNRSLLTQTFVPLNVRSNPHYHSISSNRVPSSRAETDTMHRNNFKNKVSAPRNDSASVNEGFNKIETVKKHQMGRQKQRLEKHFADNLDTHYDKSYATYNREDSDSESDARAVGTDVDSEDGSGGGSGQHFQFNKEFPVDMETRKFIQRINSRMWKLKPAVLVGGVVGSSFPVDIKAKTKSSHDTKKMVMVRKWKQLEKGKSSKKQQRVRKLRNHIPVRNANESIMTTHKQMQNTAKRLQEYFHPDEVESTEGLQIQPNANMSIASAKTIISTTTSLGKSTEKPFKTSFQKSKAMHIDAENNEFRASNELVNSMHKLSVRTNHNSNNYDYYNNNKKNNVANSTQSSVFNRGHVEAVEKSPAWTETRTRRIIGNVKKSEERSRQLLLCEEAGGGELCRMLFKGHLNE